MASEKEPKFQPVYQQILNSIQNGDYLPGDRLPTETDLAQKYMVSRNTLRQALMVLAQDGYIANRQGKGTFVLQNIPENQSSYENIANPMISCSKARITEIETSYVMSNISKDFQKRFDLDASKVIINIKRVYKAGGKTAGCSESFVPYDLLSESKVPLDSIEAISDFHDYMLKRSDLKAKSEIAFTESTENIKALTDSPYMISVTETFKGKSGKVQMIQNLYMDPSNYTITIHKPYR